MVRGSNPNLTLDPDTLRSMEMYTESLNPKPRSREACRAGCWSSESGHSVLPTDKGGPCAKVFHALVSMPGSGIIGAEGFSLELRHVRFRLGVHDFGPGFGKEAVSRFVASHNSDTAK